MNVDILTIEALCKTQVNNCSKHMVQISNISSLFRISSFSMPIPFSVNVFSNREVIKETVFSDDSFISYSDIKFDYRIPMGHYDYTVSNLVRFMFLWDLKYS